MGQPVGRVVAALIRKEGRILLVGQRGPDDPHDVWAIPGGVVEDGELLKEALIREVREETGLELIDIGCLAYATQLDDPGVSAQSFAFIFEVEVWTGTVVVDDPDGKVFAAEFFEVQDAISRLETVPWEHMRDPILAYLKGEAPRGTFWLYQKLSPGNIQLVSKL